jgi:hypothetical protein
MNTTAAMIGRFIINHGARRPQLAFGNIQLRASLSCKYPMKTSFAIVQRVNKEAATAMEAIGTLS